MPRIAELKTDSIGTPQIGADGRLYEKHHKLSEWE